MTKITTDAEALAVLARGIKFERDCQYLDDLKAAREHIAARLASTSPAPDGWVLVPMAVTAEMASAASRAARNSQVDGHKIIAIWKAMIDAAPQPVVEKDNG